MRKRGLVGVRVLLKKKESIHSFTESPLSTQNHANQNKMPFLEKKNMLMNLQTEMCKITSLHL